MLYVLLCVCSDLCAADSCVVFWVVHIYVVGVVGCFCRYELEYVVCVALVDVGDFKACDVVGLVPVDGE